MTTPLGAGGGAVEGLLFGGRLGALAVLGEALADVGTGPLGAGFFVVRSLHAVGVQLAPAQAAGLGALGALLLGGRLGSFAALGQTVGDEDASALGAGGFVISTLHALAEDRASSLRAGGGTVGLLLLRRRLRALAVVGQALMDEEVGALAARLLLAPALDAVGVQLPAALPAGVPAGQVLRLGVGLRLRLRPHAAPLHAALEGGPALLRAAAGVGAVLDAALGGGQRQLLTRGDAGVGLLAPAVGALGLPPLVQRRLSRLEAVNVVRGRVAAHRTQGQRCERCGEQMGESHVFLLGVWLLGVLAGSVPRHASAEQRNRRGGRRATQAWTGASRSAPWGQSPPGCQTSLAPGRRARQRRLTRCPAAGALHSGGEVEGCGLHDTAVGG